MRNFKLNLKWLHGSPNQTGETLTRENRLGIATCLKPLRTLCITLLLLTLGVGQMWADECGFWSDGAAHIEFTVNGSTSKTQDLNASGISDLAMGTVTTSLTLKSAWAKVWGQDKFNSITLYYRVKVADASSSAAYSSANIPWGNNFDTNNQYWANDNINATININLAPGNYEVEYYFMADAKNESDKYLSNGGSNYHANFTIPSKNLTVAGAANGNTVSGSKTGITKGTAYDITATPTTGYTFGGWSATSGSSSITIANSSSASTKVTFKNYSNNATVTASFNETMSAVTLSASPSGKGTFTIGGAAATSTSVGVTTTKSVTAVPASGYHFVSWSITGGATISGATDNPVTVTGGGAGTAATLTATFAADDVHSLTVAKETGISSVTGSTSPVTLGTKYPISATVATGYNFGGWTASPTANGTFDNASSTSTNVTVKNGSVTVTASATEIMRTITISGGHVYGGAATSTTAGVATPAKITADAPATGKKFTGWSLDPGVSLKGGYALTDQTIEIYSTANATVTATYADRAQVKMYFAKPTSLSWGTLYAYAWKSSDESVKNANYPGVTLSTTEVINCVTYYIYQYYTEGDGIGGAATGNSTWDRIIFGCGDGKQTGDLTISNGHYYYKNSSETGKATAITSAWGVKTSKDGFSGTNYITHNCGTNSGTVDISFTGGNNYTFKVYNEVNDQWWSNSTAMGSSKPVTASMAAAQTLYSNDANDMQVNAALTGSYTFIVGSTNASNPTIKVTFPEIYAVVGSFNSWNSETNPLAMAGNTGTVDIVLAPSGSNYTLKVVDNGAMYGKNSTTITGTTTVSGMSTSDGNINLKADIYPASANPSYRFSYDKSTKALTVTYPAAHTVTYGVGTHAGTASVTSSISVASGKKILDAQSITFSKGGTNTGYTWKGWYNNEAGTGDALGTDDTYTSSSRAADISVYACYNKINYTITYHLNGGSNPADPAPATSYTVTDAVTLPTPTRSGYRFLGWFTDEELTTPATNITAGTTGNKEYWAKWVKYETYNVYFYNKDKWATPKAYLWNESGHKTAWPGDAMTFHQNQVYKLDYEAADGYDKIQFNAAANKDDSGASKTEDLNLPATNSWFYNPEGAGTWTRYIMVAAFPTETIAAVLGEKVTIEPVVAWAEGISFTDISITSVRTSGSPNVNAVVAGTKLQISGTAAGTANFTVTYSYGGSEITKNLVVEIRNGVTIQAKIATTDNHWTYTNIVKVHYWGTDIANRDLTMTWMRADEEYNYYQASIPFGSDDKANFLFFYDYMNDTGTNRWRQTNNVENVTSSTCYTISYSGNESAHSNVSSEAGLCVSSWQIQVVMGSGDIYTSNIVGSNEEIISFFAPSNANETYSYRNGTVTLEHNGSTIYTYPANTFSASGVYTAKINTSTYALTDLALYDGDYYIRTDGSEGGWDNYKDYATNKLTKFTRNANFQNETFSYYWVANVARGVETNIKATVANEYNPVLCNFTPDESANAADGINLRFGYEPTTNDIVRGIIGGSTTNNYLNIVLSGSSLVYKEIGCTTLLDESHYSSDPHDSKLQDKSNWVYEIIVYAKIDGSHPAANVVLKSYYGGIHYLLGMEKDTYGRETSTPVAFPVINDGTTGGIYGLRVVYDFKTNRLFAAWAPADRVIDGVLSVDADVMFLRHEEDDAAQISFNTAASKVEDLKQAIFALELDNEKTKSGNIERHYFISLPFDCKVSNIFGIGGFMNYWGIQRYRGDLRAEKGWFQDTPTFWEWLGADDVMQAGEGYLLSVDKKALENDEVWKEGIIYQVQEPVVDGSGNPIKTSDGLSDSVVWKTKTDGSMLTMYFPSTSTGFEITPATGEALTITYPNQPCTITRNNRDKQDSNWKCIGTPGYKNITVNSYSAESGELVYNENTAPRFLYEFQEQTSGQTWAKGSYNVTDGSSYTYHSFKSYMVQFAGTIEWAQYSKGDAVPASIAPRRAKNYESQATKAEIKLVNTEGASLDHTFVWLVDGATTGFDQNYDLNKMIEKRANQIYSVVNQDVPFAANVLPLETDTVPLVVNIVNGGEYTFSLDTAKHEGIAPVLYDAYKSQKTDLLVTDYSVGLEEGKYEGRFYLIFSPVANTPTDLGNVQGDGVQSTTVRKVMVDGMLYIVKDGKVYDAQGTRVK